MSPEEKELAEARRQVALLTAAKIALETRQKGKDEPRVENSEDRRRIYGLEADIRDLQKTFSEQEQARAAQHRKELEEQQLRHREQQQELRTTIARLSQQLQLSQMDSQGVAGTLEERAALLSAVERELAEALARGAELEADVVALRGSVQALEGNLALSAHEKEQLLHAKQALEERLSRGGRHAQRRWQRSDDTGQELTQARDAAAHAQLEARVATARAETLESELRVARQELEHERTLRIDGLNLAAGKHEREAHS